MDKQEEKKELLVEQRKIADYAYNNYVVYHVDETEVDRVIAELRKENENMTPEEYASIIRDVGKEYSDITSIKFTSVTIDEMGSLVFYFVINDVIKDSVPLDTKSAETNQWIYSMNRISDRGGYSLEKKTEPTNSKFNENKIVYYEGGLD